MSSNDKDFRFMATSDLMNDLQKESIKLDDDSERRIVKGVLKLLEDTNGEVQNQAVKCLGPLVCKVKEPQIEIICDTLCLNCTNMSKDAEQLRDISSSGLKTVIASLATTNSGATNNISKKIMQRLLTAIQQGTSTTNNSNAKKSNNTLDLANGGQSQLEILDIISDMLSRFGANLSFFHQQLKQILLSHLNSNRSAVRKRVTTSLSYLLETCDIQLFNEILTILLNELQRKPSSTAMNKKSSSNETNATIKTYVQALTSICRLASQRLSEHMHEIVRITLSFIENTPSNSSNDDQQYDDELIEYCLQALETYLKRCPKETNEFVPKIVDICIVYLKYDPNFNYDNDDNDMSDDQSDDDGDDDKDQDSYSDDDDLSWKVRHSAAKCIEAVVVTQHDILQTNYYRKIVPVLIERFLERENTVKADIFHCFITILQQTKTACAHQQQQQHQQPHHTVSSSVHDDEDSMDTDHLTSKNSYVSPLAEYVPLIVRSLAKIMKDKDTKNREGSLVVLTNLVHVQRNILIEHIDTIVPNTLYSLSTIDKTKKSKGQLTEGVSTQTVSKSLHSNLKITALAFLYALLQTHDDSIRFHKHIKSLLPLIILHANDSFYKIASEALLVLQELVKIIRPKSSIAIQNEFKPFVEQIYECTQKRLKQKDFDQEVKERAITCFSYVIVYLGDLLSAEQLQSCWPVLTDLLRNEITRLPTVRALTNIVDSPLNLDLQTILIETVPILSSYLRQNHRTLKMNTLTCLRSMIKLYSKHFNKTMIKAILIELPLLINENDLLLAQNALKLTTSICKIPNNQTSLDKEQINSILNKVLELIQSPLLQGTALDAVIEFLRSLVPQCISYEELVKLLIKPIYSQQKTGTTPTTASHTPTTSTTDHHQQQLVVHKQAFYSIAKSFAALTVENLKESSFFIKKFQDDLNDPKCSDSIKILALLCLGETGKYTDLAQSSSNLQQILLEIFSSPSDDLRTAASYTLGYIGIRNLNAHIPFLLSEIARSQTKRQYLLLHSLREIISYQSHENLPQLDGHIDSIWRTLFAHCECPEEGTRNVVAECLGKLTLLKPEKLLPILRETFVNHTQKKQVTSPHVRSTIITAIKFTIVDQPQHIDTILKSYIKDFLNGLEDEDIDVRRVALVMFNSAAHNKPMLIRDLLKELLPKLYNETRVRQDLIREVEMGPFKHTVDDGLDLRKAAYECMYTLLDTCLDKLDMFDYLTYVEDGLKQDHYDIRMLTFLMVVRLSILCPTIVLQRLDRLIQPLKSILYSKVKANSIKQEFEKHDELRRAAIKVFLALQQIKDANKVACINDFEASIKSSKEFQDLYNTVIHEQQQSSSTFSFNTNNNSEAMDMS
ncbi:unnamed protein product [Adineta steineri]|uniref:TATA-binding protein interacting (TIP20) domain-containing protein n=1 Tax=Adineta steineri TaxID=433720 RepID=A0A814JMV6_9BILA|nr:unnamed protein product [Adineta steineri]CAF1037972.1 unnamed protein product [Adineta steineri]